MSEHDDQAALFQWARMHDVGRPELKLLFAIPNGTRTTPQVAKRMVDEGVRKGVPDVCLPVARGGYHGLFIEMKSEGAYPRPEQREWLGALKAQGYYTACCHSWTEAAELTEKYLDGGLKNA